MFKRTASQENLRKQKYDEANRLARKRGSIALEEVHQITASMKEALRIRSDEAGNEAEDENVDGKHVLLQQQSEICDRQNPASFPYNSNPFIISPLSSLRLKWDLATATFLTYVAVITPYELAFLGTDAGEVPSFLESSAPLKLLFIVNRLVDMFFLCDLILNFMTGVGPFLFCFGTLHLA